MKSIIVDYNSFRNQVLILLDKSNSIPDPKLLLNFLVNLYSELELVDFYIDSLEKLFQIVEISLKNQNDSKKLFLSSFKISNLLDARKNFRHHFQGKEFVIENGWGLLKELIFLQIIELIVEIESWSDFDKWENLSVYMYIDAWISWLIDSLGSNKNDITSILVCAFIEFWKYYE